MRKKDPTENQNQLGNLLERYKRILHPPQATVEKEAIDVIKNLTGITVKNNQLRYSVGTRTLSISAPSLIRSELRSRHREILTELQKRLGVAHAPTAII
jgi:hypothetical protein